MKTQIDNFRRYRVIQDLQLLEIFYQLSHILGLILYSGPNHYNLKKQEDWLQISRQDLLANDQTFSKSLQCE